MFGAAVVFTVCVLAISFDFNALAVTTKGTESSENEGDFVQGFDSSVNESKYHIICTRKALL